MHNEIDINVSAVIFSTIKKMRYHQGYMYEFNGLLTRYLRNLGVEGELLNNRIVVGTYIIDLS